MAYTVLARRYRSTTFDEVVGQAHVAQTLKRAIESGRIAHAYLFCGTRGTGKTSMARILAKALNCLSSPGPTSAPCGTCTSCQGIARGDDMDYIEIDAASNTQVEKTRDAIIDNVAYRPARCRFKIFLIDEVHMLSKGSFNALLKTLEEPPEHVKFILATTEAEKIPNTILSRCQRYDFKNIPTREVAGHLAAICKGEGIAAEEDALLMVARAGGGSMRDSLSLLDRLLSVGEKTLTVEGIEALLGLPRAEQVAAMVEAMGNADAGGVLKKADEILASGMSPDSLISGLVDHLHNLLLLRVCGEKTELVEAPGIRPEVLWAQAKKIDSVILTQDIAVLEELRRQLRSGAGGRALMDATLVRLALAEQFRSITSLWGEVAEGGVSVAGGAGALAEKKKYDVAPLAATAERVALPSPSSSIDEGSDRSGASGAEEVADRAGLPPQRPAPTLPPAPVVSSAPAAASDDDDDLPRPGKVWDNSGPSLAEMLKARSGEGEGDAKASVSPEAIAHGRDARDTRNIEFVDEGKLPAIWKSVLENFRRSQPALYGALQSTQLNGVSGGQATVEFESSGQFFARQVEKDGKREKVAAALSEALGTTVGVRIVVKKDAAPAAVAEAVPVAKVVRPSLKDIEQMARNAPPVALASVAPTATSSGASVVRVSDELVAELKQDDLVRAVVEGLGGQIVKVTEE